MPISDKKSTSGLKGSSLFSYFSVEELEMVASMVKTKQFKKGELIFREGEEGEELFLVEEGKVAISKPVKGNLEQVLAHLGPGDHFGEMAILEKIPRTASASAEENCLLLVVSENDLLHMMEEHPKAAAKIMFNLLRTFNARLKATNEQVREAVRWGLEATGYHVEG